MKKPKDINEIRNFLFNKLKEEYGDNVLYTEESDKIVVDTDSAPNGTSDVWIRLNYFY